MNPSAADWDTLQKVITGEVLLPGSPSYELVRKPPIARFHSMRPQAVVQCRTPADVAAAISFARRHGLHLVARGGGHSAAGRSSTEGIVLDLTPMSEVTVADSMATVGAGARLGNLYDALAGHGRTIAAGCGSSVGIAGLTLGGGLGIMGRKHGLTCDQLLSAQVVLADGSVADCDEHTHKELFWALRGAGGGNFGIVTSLVFRTIAAPRATVFHLAWPIAHAAAVIQAWQAWAPAAPDELDATLRLTPAGDGGPVAHVSGAMLSSQAEAAKLIGELIAQAGANPASASCQYLPYRQAKRYLERLGSAGDPPEPTSAGQPPRHGHLYSKSEFFRQPLPDQAITALVDNFCQWPTPGGLSREVSFLPWGGAYNRVPAGATAFAHRAELFLIQHLVVTGPGGAAGRQPAARQWLERSWSVTHPWGSGGVYPNFPDPDLADWASAYHRSNYNRLVHVKARYDPDGLFRFHQSIPPGLEHNPGASQGS